MDLDDMCVNPLHQAPAFTVGALVIPDWNVGINNLCPGLAGDLVHLPVLVRMTVPDVSWHLCIGPWTEWAIFLWPFEGSVKQKDRFDDCMEGLTCTEGLLYVQKDS